jgi:hypothetical protein
MIRFAKWNGYQERKKERERERERAKEREGERGSNYNELFK